MAAGGRIARRFAALKAENRAACMVYIMAGDPDLAATRETLAGLPAAGVDLIELGVPFTDPMADGPAIQVAGQRALANKTTLGDVLDLVAEFRRRDMDTPIILMGYYNPISSMGVAAFLARATEVGVDGLIVVDLPPEEDPELCLPARDAGIDFIRLATPTTDAARLPSVLQNASGFVYYVSITGVTGAAAADPARVAPDVARIRAESGLPVVVGFGVKNPDIAEAVAEVADGVVIGSAVVERLGAREPVESVLGFVRALSDGVRRANRAG